MKRFHRTAILLLFVLLIALLAGIVVLLPRIHVAILVHRLHTAHDVPATAAIAQRLVALNSDQAFDAIDEYADKNPLVAFDRRHGLLLLHDDATGMTHIVRPQIEWSEVNSPSRPNGVASADSVSIRLSIKTMAQSLAVGDPPVIMSGVFLLDSTDGGVDFVLKAASDHRYYRYRFAFEEGATNTMTFDVTEEEISNWSQRSDWPSSWK